VPDDEERDLYAKKTQLRFNLDVNRAFCKAFGISADVAKSLKADVLNNLNWDRADVSQQWRLYCATSMLANVILHLPVGLYAKRFRPLECAGSVELGSINEEKPVDRKLGAIPSLTETPSSFTSRPSAGRGFCSTKLQPSSA
jgi:hypothetical protein